MSQNIVEYLRKEVIKQVLNTPWVKKVWPTWDAVYSATKFRSSVTVRRDGYAITDAARFTYSFVTVPTVKPSKFKKDSIPVLRVRSLSGGNYWGMSSAPSIADLIKEMINRNLKSGHTSNHLTTIKAAIPDFNYSYFQI